MGDVRRRRGFSPLNEADGCAGNGGLGFLHGGHGGLGGGVEFCNGPLFKGLIVGEGRGAVSAKAGQIDLKGENLIGGEQLKAALGFSGFVFLHEPFDNRQLSAWDFTR